MNTIPCPKQLDFQKSQSPRDEWTRFKDAWNNYEIATELQKKEEQIRLATFLSIIGDQGIERFNTYKFKEPEKVKKMETLLQLFEEDCKDKKNIIHQRYLFLRRK